MLSFRKEVRSICLIFGIEIEKRYDGTKTRYMGVHSITTIIPCACLHKFIILPFRHKHNCTIMSINKLTRNVVKMLI